MKKVLLDIKGGIKMKKVLLVIFSVLMLSVLPSNHAYASASTTNTFSIADYTVTLLSPRMHYRIDDLGNTIPLDIRFDYGGRSNVPYQFQLRRLDNHGNAIEIIRIFNGSTPTDGIVNLNHVFEEVGFPYEVVDSINGVSIMKGFVLERPSDSFRSIGPGRELFFGLAVNDVAYNTSTDFLFDGKNHQQHLVKQGDYFILHYRFPIDSLGNDYRIKFAYENENKIVLEFSADDIYTFQGGTQPAHRRGFIVVSTNGDIPAFVDNRDNIAVTSFSIADNPFTAKFEKGVYTMAGFDNENNKKADGQSPLLIGSRADREWHLTADSLSVRQGYPITWHVFRETKEISDVFNMHFFLDIPSQKDFREIISREYNRMVNLRYVVNDKIGIGEKGSVSWFIERQGDWFFGLPRGKFNYELISEYTIRFPQPIEDSLKDFLGNFGLNNTIGYIIFSVIILIAVTFVLAFYGAGTTAIAVANFGLIGIFAVLGFIPLWLIVGMVMFGVIGLIAVLRGREG